MDASMSLSRYRLNCTVSCADRHNRISAKTFDRGPGGNRAVSHASRSEALKLCTGVSESHTPSGVDGDPGSTRLLRGPSRKPSRRMRAAASAFVKWYNV